MIGITDEGIFGKHGFDGLESLVTLRCPHQGTGSCQDWIRVKINVI
jgi:hypothetical protein